MPPDNFQLRNNLHRAALQHPHIEDSFNEKKSYYSSIRDKFSGIAESSWRLSETDLWWIPLWKVFFAVMAIADLSTCWPSLVGGWKEQESDSCSTQHPGFLSQNGDHDGGFCPNTSPPSWIGPFFCLLCFIEATIRAREARALAIEMDLLDAFEKKLTRVYSTTRMSFGFLRVDSSNTSYVDAALAKSTLRTWIPVASVMLFWLSLLPTNYKVYQCGNDAALATIWTATSLARLAAFNERFQEWLSSALWEWALPFKLYQPKRLTKRIRDLLRWIRYLRFAGPLLRMGLKLGDQLWALSKTWRQSITAQTERAKRIARPSMLFEDLKRIESLTKVQTALASLPSQLFHMAQSEMADIGKILAEKQAEGQRIRRQLRNLRADIGQSFESAGALYDRITQMTQDIKVAFNDSLLSSHNLIDPHSRFGVVWRVTVTNCLLLEIFRLTVSWQLSGTFKVPLSRAISRLLIECDKSAFKKRFGFITDRIDETRSHLSRVIPFLPPPADFVICEPSNQAAKIFLWLGGYLENFIDVVCFLDIFIWFSTGELDAKGVVVPKPFFYRCILPGTLTQVLDHPTLPRILPTLIARAVDATKAVGWSRVIRWILAVGPAFVMLVVDPLKNYFFRHVDSNDPMMSYAERYVTGPILTYVRMLCFMLLLIQGATVLFLFFSVGMLGGYRHPTISSDLHNLNKVVSYPSQIGLMQKENSYSTNFLPPHYFESERSDDFDDSYRFDYNTLQY